MRGTVSNMLQTYRWPCFPGACTFWRRLASLRSTTPAWLCYPWTGSTIRRSQRQRGLRKWHRWQTCPWLRQSVTVVQAHPCVELLPSSSSLTIRPTPLHLRTCFAENEDVKHNRAHQTLMNRLSIFEFQRIDCWTQGHWLDRAIFGPHGEYSSRTCNYSEGSNIEAHYNIISE